MEPGITYNQNTSEPFPSNQDSLQVSLPSPQNGPVLQATVLLFAWQPRCIWVEWGIRSERGEAMLRSQNPPLLFSSLPFYHTQENKTRQTPHIHISQNIFCGIFASSSFFFFLPAFASFPFSLTIFFFPFQLSCSSPLMYPSVVIFSASSRICNFREGQRAE